MSYLRDLRGETQGKLLGELTVPIYVYIYVYVLRIQIVVAYVDWTEGSCQGDICLYLCILIVEVVRCSPAVRS